MITITPQTFEVETKYGALKVSVDARGQFRTPGDLVERASELSLLVLHFEQEKAEAERKRLRQERLKAGTKLQAMTLDGTLVQVRGRDLRSNRYLITLPGGQKTSEPSLLRCLNDDEIDHLKSLHRERESLLTLISDAKKSGASYYSDDWLRNDDPVATFDPESGLFAVEDEDVTLYSKAIYDLESQLKYRRYLREYPWGVVIVENHDVVVSSADSKFYRGYKTREEAQREVDLLEALNENATVLRYFEAAHLFDDTQLDD